MTIREWQRAIDWAKGRKRMGHSAIGHAGTHTTLFPVGTHVGYKPGGGTYGYEDVPRVDGRIMAKVLGHSATRVRIEMIWWLDTTEKPIDGMTRVKCRKTVAVDAESLVKIGERPGVE